MSNEVRPIVLSLITLGTPTSPRFAIADQFMRYYKTNDSGWTEPERLCEAAIYADSNRAIEDMRRLLVTHFADKPVVRFCAPVYIDLHADQELTVEQLQAWLMKTAKLIIDSPKHGNGPVAGSLGICRIQWDELKRLDEEAPKQ